MSTQALAKSQGLLLRELRRDGPLTRAELVLRTGLSRSTVHGLTEELVAHGLIGPVAYEGAPGRGRPPAAFAYRGAGGHVLALAFEQDRVSAALADLNGRVLHEITRLADVARDAEQALRVAAEAASAVAAGTDPAPARPIAAVAALPGPVDHARGTIGAFSILRSWSGLDARGRLSEILGVATTIDNDANLAAYAESRSGAARGCRHLLYVKASTGVGAGLILDGRIYRGAHGMAGELGHVTVDPAGRICRCGSRGCLETVTGSGGITDSLIGTHPEGITIAELVNLARAGDAAATRALADAGSALGQAIGEVINVLNPAEVVVGGELAAAAELVVEPMRQALRQAAMQVIANRLEIRAAELGPRADLLGAALYAAALAHEDEPALR